MPKTISLSLLILALALSLLSACAVLRDDTGLPARHPFELDAGRPLCSGCHEARGEAVNFVSYDHTPYWADNHRQPAYQGERLCSLCHQTSFCNDCHATRVELKPSLKLQSDTYRRLPHRGDYRSRHFIDGRIDPTACFRCHGNPKSAATCRACHG